MKSVASPTNVQHRAKMVGPLSSAAHSSYATVPFGGGSLMIRA